MDRNAHFGRQSPFDVGRVRDFPERTPDRQQVLAEARTTFLNTNLSDTERLDALSILTPPRSGGPTRPYHDPISLRGAVAIAAVQLAGSAADPEVRAAIWHTMASVDDPESVQPLLHALQYDDAERVRVAAARALRYILDTPGVRDALEDALAYDSSQRVRLEIQDVLQSDADRDASLIAVALDTTAKEYDRVRALARLRHDEFLDPMPLSDDVIVSMIALAETSRSASIRRRVWFYLGDFFGDEGTYLIDSMLEALGREPDESVRENLVGALGRHLEHAGVRGALEHIATDDESPLLRKSARESLDSRNRCWPNLVCSGEALTR